MANGDPRYELIDFSRYGSAQDMYNENIGFGGTQNFYDYDGDSLLDNFPVRPKAPYVQPTSRNTQPLINIPGGIGTYNAAGAQNQNLGGPNLQTATPPPMPLPVAPEATFGEKFGANMMTPQAMTGVAKGIGGLIQGLVGRGRRRDEQRKAQNQYDDMLKKYRGLSTRNLAENIKNPYANIQTNFENVYEDLTVNRQQAEFERDMFARQQASLMQGLSGAAGGSGIAALAQAMANQGQIAAQRSSASIGQQEAVNQRLLAQGAAREQELERRAELQIAQGQGIVDQLKLRGAEKARSLTYQKTGTELGMAQQDLAAKNMAIAQADAALYGGIGSLVGTGVSAAIGAA
tara:strand:+ start:338 stop:1378 length:1041 start_codon:yes stop_codon:yes gene_type:complete